MNPAPPVEIPLPVTDVLRPPRSPFFSPMTGGWLRHFRFRFLSLYLIIFQLGRILGFVPGLGWFRGRVFQSWRQVTPWFDREVLRLLKQFNR